jgi:hypothetical protein
MEMSYGKKEDLSKENQAAGRDADMVEIKLLILQKEAEPSDWSQGFFTPKVTGPQTWSWGWRP